VELGSFGGAVGTLPLLAMTLFLLAMTMSEPPIFCCCQILKASR
jgi:hypothetical protein